MAMEYRNSPCLRLKERNLEMELAWQKIRAFYCCKCQHHSFKTFKNKNFKVTKRYCKGVAFERGEGCGQFERRDLTK